MEFTPYKINETLNYMFYQVPMELFFNTKYKHLSLEAKVLYGLLLSQLTLSIKNNWQDENGNVYIILTREKAQELLNISDKTATKAFMKRNKDKLNLILFMLEKLNMMIVFLIWFVKNTIHDSENLRPNYNNKNYNNRTNKNFSKFDQRCYAEGELDFLYANNPNALCDN